MAVSSKIVFVKICLERLLVVCFGPPCVVCFGPSCVVDRHVFSHCFTEEIAIKTTNVGNYEDFDSRSAYRMAFEPNIPCRLLMKTRYITPVLLVNKSTRRILIVVASIILAAPRQ